MLFRSGFAIPPIVVAGPEKHAHVGCAGESVAGKCLNAKAIPRPATNLRASRCRCHGRSCRVSLGLSLALFYLAMQQIGAGRTGLISSTSTLWGIVAALILLHEGIGWVTIAGGLLMLVGLGVFAWEMMTHSN